MDRRQFAAAVAATILTAAPIAPLLAQGTSRAAHTGTRRVRDAARAFLAVLDDDARKAVTFPLDSMKRTAWSNLPVSIVPRSGISIGSLTNEGRRRLHDLIRASTSSQGYHKITSIIRHDGIFRANELAWMETNPPRPFAGRPAVESMGVGSYWVSIFGDPTAPNWGWLITGHHLGATFTCFGDQLASVPLFLGVEPVEELKGPTAGMAALSHESIRGLDLVRSLKPAQTKVAVLASEPHLGDILSGIGRRNSLSKFEGLPASELDAPQRRLLMALLHEYVRNADIGAADRHIAVIERSGWRRLHFSWRGRTDDLSSPFYYRIHGPRLLIEYAVQAPNHVHTIMRDPANDYGMDWLKIHYEEHTARR